MKNQPILTPVQQKAAKCLLCCLQAGEVVVLEGRPGMGKTTILREVHRQAGGTLAGMRQFLDLLMARGPAAIEGAFLDLLDTALAAHDIVFVDDLHLVTNVVESWGYSRTFLLDAALTAILGEAAAQGKKIVFATAAEAPWPVRRRAFTCEIGEFAAED